jgi:type II secretory ATPase GspE/PulE/Tfp pilus assembly ATPase PilB-like protein
MAEIIADVSQAVGYLPLVKALVLVVLLAPWLHVAPWVHRDASRLTSSPGVWNGVVLGAGAVGVVVWLVMPYYVIGALVYVVLAAGGLGAYVAYRDSHVDEEHKVLSTAHLLSALKRERRELELLTKVTIYDSDEHVIFPPDMSEASEEEMATYNLVQELLHDIVWRRASQVDITPVGQGTRVLYVIDGVATERPALTLAQSEAVAQYLKPYAGMDAEERRRPQTGSISVDLGGSRADMEVATAGTTGGQRLQFRIIQEVVRTRLEELGMPEDLQPRLRAVAEADNGLFLVSGRRGSGVTSTLYSILRLHDAYMNHVVSLEASPAIDLENVTQQPYDDDSKVARILAAILKRGADVLMVDNCPDAQTADLIVQAAAKKPVMLGIQATDSFVALAKWVRVCGDAAGAVASLRGVLCQMLLRKICPSCREAYRPDPKRLAKLNLATAKIDVFYRPPTEPQVDKKGQPVVCQVCQGSGYRGRTAAFELLELNDEIRQLIAGGAAVAQIRSACRKNRMLYLQEQALRKVIQGETSIQEVIRISQQARKKK